MTIRLRLTLLFVVLLGAIGLVRVGLVLAGFSNTLWQDAQAHVARRSHQVSSYLLERQAGFTPSYLRNLAPLDAPDALPRAFSDDGIFVQLTGLDGRVLNKSANLGRHRLPAPEAAGISIITLERPRLFETGRVVVHTQPYGIPGRPQVAWVQSARPLDDDNKTVRQLALVEGGGWLFSLLLAFGVGYAFAGRALAPVAAMTDAVKQMQTTELHRRLPVPDPPKDELEHLGATFNGLFERLERAFDAQRRFVADASHELRSPLTVVRGNLQLVQKRGASNPEEAKLWLSTALRELDRLTRLVNDLLELARLGENRLPPVSGRVDLAAIASDVVTQFRQTTPRVTLEPPGGPLWVTGDADRLRQVLHNMLDNAVRATRDAGGVTVKLESDAQQALLTVADTGVGMAPEVLTHIFDRFYRVDSARDRSSGGSGLGLAISAGIVAAHRGVIDVKSAPGQGSTFVVRLPLAPAEPPPAPRATA